MDKNLPASAGDMGSISGSGKISRAGEQLIPSTRGLEHPGACATQEKPSQGEAHALQQRAAPVCTPEESPSVAMKTQHSKKKKLLLNT